MQETFGAVRRGWARRPPRRASTATTKTNGNTEMQNKRPFLQRLLIIYIAFFCALAAGLAMEFLPGFSRGYADGDEISMDLARNWGSGTPRLIYMLENILVDGGPENIIELPEHPNMKIDTKIRQIGLVVEQEAPGASIFGLAFRSLGGSGWIYASVMLTLAAYLTIVVLMFLIIHSVRRSIREERTLDKRNIWYLRAIGGLAIASELADSVVAWTMNRRAAELLAGSQYSVDTSFHLSYSTIIIGILIIFAAEVFAIGRNLSEEQKLTI